MILVSVLASFRGAEIQTRKSCSRCDSVSHLMKFTGYFDVYPSVQHRGDFSGGVCQVGDF